MTDRRNFVTAVSAAGLCLVNPMRAGHGSRALSVDAVPTVFFAHPDGTGSLVRFKASGIDAPAGRLRVFDRSRRLLGTAGLLRSGDSLYGELWMQLENGVSVVSELEAPGVNGPFRTAHRLVPERRWTIHLLTFADSEAVGGVLDRLRPFHRITQTAIYRSSAVTLNPLPRSSEISSWDHVPFIRLSQHAASTGQRFAIPIGTAAYLPPGVFLPKTGAAALAGAGVQILVRQQADGSPFEWWGIPGGKRVLVVSVPGGSSPADLGFDQTQNEMARRLEDWLSSTALRFSQGDVSGTAVIMNTDAAAALPETLVRASEWNSRFAFPRIVVGDDYALFHELESRAPGTTVTAPTSINRLQMPARVAAASKAASRSVQMQQRTRDLERVFAAAVIPGSSNLESVAASIATAVAGSMVFNPSPYSQSALVRMSDGSDRMASNIPGLGYAFFPDVDVAGGGGGWEPVSPRYSAEGQELRVSIDRTTGAISSLVHKDTGRDWVRTDTSGMNAIEGARLERVSVSRIAGVATRIVLARRAPIVGALTTEVTLFDGLPWLCLANATQTDQAITLTYRFDLAISDPKVSWELPMGYDEASLPIPLLEHLRWIRIEDGDASFMLRGFDAPLVSVDENGTMTSHAPGGSARYRIGLASRYSSRDEPWVFGWNAEPMRVVRAEPSGFGTLPRFGAMLTFEQVGIAVLGILPARDGYGVIVYLQETLGVSRDVPVGPGVLQFRYAEAVDYLERYLHEIRVTADGTISVPIPADGVVALRLSGLEPSEVSNS